MAASSRARYGGTAGTLVDTYIWLGVKFQMSHKRADQITVSGEWAKHLRPYGKREFWKAERRASGEHALKEATGRIRSHSYAHEGPRIDLASRS